MQLVGLPCVLCNRSVDSILEGRFCNGWGGAVHKKCIKAPAAAESGQCAVCGSTRGTFAETMPRPQVPQNVSSAPPLTAHGGLVGFFAAAADLATVDEATLQQAGEAALRHSGYHKVIVTVAVVFGLIGVVLGVSLGIFSADAAKTGRDVRGIVMAPFVFAAAGILFGFAIACLFAPRAFLTGPFGKKWMALIGTTNVTVARIVCRIFGLVVTAPFVGLGLLIVMSER
jgi:hypothetical protein